MRRAARTDTTSADIIRGLRGIGAIVKQPPPPARWGDRGFPDAFVRYRGQWFPMDFKSKGGKAAASQIKWWGELGMEPVLIHTLEEAMRHIGAEEWTK